ncbi:MAG TPA: ABC transporter ATP-binding protein [Candidatus Hydrogenedentes bacterium]|jgi:oligopeptide transport system ATP-binding protein|nr:MAG: Oligopeptide transport ATP-binding protein OppD [Candidatus Hydrogenedentes bacterium ADurb.Bin170]HNZ48028.1 ABC transporter ATP-binding protein [Candidatus Hydrogenedentota bacterium]HOD95318.1 ABC transporter ATP-binding protein [Candidatus Hydrogenedentota bacterium]HOR50773.1 ABC transporter ATP-binding protein [Candidatus Hydrogenedentota bacterium]HPK24635.1 ABC transporter ATP-binding protein [Candidatus Hydrogenedentota bacterium]
METASPLLKVNDLRTWFHTRDGIIRAVDGVSFSIDQGETVGIVGESGCGKSALFYSLLGLLPMPPARIESGSAFFRGEDLLRASPERQRALRGRQIAMIFQDPMTALNPYMKIGAQIIEPLLVHRLCTPREAHDRALAMMHAVGIQDGEQRMAMYPHEFSGGMRQRVVIAMALITRPELVIADEPTTALDVTVQAQVLALLTDLQKQMGMSVALITHNLGIVSQLCSRVIVLYGGRIMETAPAKQLFEKPLHPYTAALLASLPRSHRAGEALAAIPGQPPEKGAPEAGCPFAPRCRYTQEACYKSDCPLLLCSPGRQTACLRVNAGELQELMP